MTDSLSMLRDETARLRASLIDQMAYLIDELEAQKPLMDRLPAWAFEGRPFAGTWTIKEMYGLLAAADERVFLPQVKQMVAGTGPKLEPPDHEALWSMEPWAEATVSDLLTRLQSARTQLVALLSDLPASSWVLSGQFGETQRDLYTHVHAIIQHDADCLRDVGQRLHESDLTQRQTDLPE